MSDLIVFCAIVYGVAWGLTLAYVVVGVVLIFAKGALCALWRKVW